jgi:hypothetical protein
MSGQNRPGKYCLDNPEMVALLSSLAKTMQN